MVQLAPARHRTTGRIGLRYTRGGIGTPFFGPDVQLRIAGSEVVAVRSGVVTTAPVTTVADAAELAGITPGVPRDVYEPTTSLDPTIELASDPDAANLLGDWYGFVCSVVEHLRAEATVADDASRVQLWPEHLRGVAERRAPP